MAASDLLKRHAQILLKQNRIQNMPAIKATLRKCIIIMIRTPGPLIVCGIIRISEERRIVILLHSLPVHLLCKAPGTAEIVLHTGSADRRICLISVNIELHLTFAIPVTLQ